ncbi:hypothetical protein BX600DRAFT_451171 [Xylariales sp. PMI_506]|nr:hypothetical protein BX600DRAFT_451171 [Xylariales sp. PMI_506]
MHLLSTLTALLLHASAVCFATPIVSLRGTSAPACTYLASVADGAPSCPGGCCGWRITGTPDGAVCTTWTSSAVALTSRPAGWLESCSELQSAQLTSEAAIYILTSYTQGSYNAVVSNSGCVFEVNISSPNNADSIHIASGDISQFLAAGIASSQDGEYGATGSTECWAYNLQWRMVPPGN